jgi:hypothetical protein
MPADAYQSLTPGEKLELLDEVSRRTGLASVVLEKDYWVCRTLSILFSLQHFAPHLVFKGGTSLSKVYRLIERFSEDIDISIHREFLGVDASRDPEKAESKKDAERRIDALHGTCVECIRRDLVPALAGAIEAELGTREGWSLAVDPNDPQTINFGYPRSGVPALAYIQEIVRIEMGARSDQWPRQEARIRSYIGESLDQPFGVATVHALAAERTFWEKATLIHAECHRPMESPIPGEYARHYHDLARLAVTPIADKALNDAELRKRVVIHKTIYFRSARARYDLAVPGSFRLVPDEGRLPELERDHEAMTQMFFSPPPPFLEVLKTLRLLETRINALQQ